MMKYLFTILPLLLLVTAGLHAEEKRHGPEAIEVRIETGTKDGQLKFVPDKLRFERGKYYKLVIHNPSNDEHYFTSDGLATHVFTRKVEVAGKDHKTIVEIHGAVNDIELKPGATVEWYFYPMTNGTNLKLYCHKENHEAQGMSGLIEIFGSPPFTK
jgi:uncharacterized cupredoxin-like copper-binding protein